METIITHLAPFDELVAIVPTSLEEGEKCGGGDNSCTANFQTHVSETEMELIRRVSKYVQIRRPGDPEQLSKITKRTLAVDGNEKFHNIQGKLKLLLGSSL